jgi:hypothetical protein
MVYGENAGYDIYQPAFWIRKKIAALRLSALA